MKLKPALMLFSLFLMFAFVGFATADTTPTDTSQSAALATPAECGNGEVDIIANLFAPPIVKMGFTDTCGNCSVSQCRGATRGQQCWTGSSWANCIPQLTNLCPGTQDWDCQCGGFYF